MVASRALQRSLRELLPFYYFQDVEQLRVDSPAAAAMLLWSALPISTDIRVVGDTIEINADLSDPGEKDVYWDWRLVTNRERMIEFRETGPRLARVMAAAEKRLREAGRTGQADAFRESEGNRRALIEAARWREVEGEGKPALFGTLLRLESVITEGAARALRDIQSFQANAATLPSKAIERLADFGAEITHTFHDRVASVYGGDSLRSLGSMVFLEASRALGDGGADGRPSALLSLTVLRDDRTFRLPDFLKGDSPAAGDVAVAHRLVSAP
jgi:hypothetical protein